jgi:hypothetical protein
VEGPGELHHNGGGIQGRTPFHDPLEDLHEQQFATAKSSVNGTERLPDEGALSAGRPVHGHPGDQGASVRPHQGPVEVLSESRCRAIGTAPEASDVAWRRRNCGDEGVQYITTTTVNFGDKPAGCIAIAAARETAERFGAKFPEAAWFLKFRTYVDDATAGADTMARLEELSSEMEALARQGGFEFKETLMSGDKEKDDGEPHKVLGLIWETEEDRLRVDVKLNLGAKRAGLHLLGNVELEDEPEKALPGVITKRELWRVAQGQYDPLGLLSGYTVRFKVLMRSLAEESTGRVVGWDEPVPEEFREVVKHLTDLRAITFPRAAKPREPVIGKPILMIFGDGSTLASCALAYLRWQMADGSVQCRLLAGKTRVAPKCKISIPRMELVGALLVVRLAHKIIDSLHMELEVVRYFTDSSAVLGMLNKDSASFLEFVDTRVSEIRIKSNPDKEWFWIPGELNLEDQGTWPTVLPQDMAPGTPYQDGLPWMRDPVEAWPVKKKFTTPPVEECRKDVLNVAGGLSATPGLVCTQREQPHEGQAGAHLRICVHGDSTLQEAASFQPSRSPGRGSREKGAMDRIRATSREVPDGGAAISFAGRPGGSGREADGEPDGGEEAPDRRGLPEEDDHHGGGPPKEASLDRVRPGRATSVAPGPRASATLLAGSPRAGSCRSGRHDHEKQVQRVDHKNPAQGAGCEECLLHVQETREGAGKPEDGPPSCPPDGANAALLVHDRGSVRATLHRGHREQADN